MSKLDADNDDGDLTDLLGELRVLLPTAQLLSAFLTTVPFSSGFGAIVKAEKIIFLITFILSITSLVLLSAPAVQHRLMRPLASRSEFKRRASSQVLLGAIALAVALTLVTQLVLSEVLDDTIGTVVAIGIALVIITLWWVLPKRWRSRGHI